MHGKLKVRKIIPPRREALLITKLVFIDKQDKNAQPSTFVTVLRIFLLKYI